MLRLKLLLPAILFSACILCGAKEKGRMAYSGFDGGMLLHSGYVSGRQMTFTTVDGGKADMTMRGAPIGIGGALKVGFGKHFRVGGEGYVSRLYYGEHRSTESIGWGGVLADCVWSKGRWSWFVGATVGGGSVKNVTLLEDMATDCVLENNSASYRQYGFVALVPFAGMEYALTEKFRLTAKIDWIFNASNPQPDFVTGPRVYIGFMFHHSN